MTFLIIWWAIGIISYLAGCVIVDKELTPQNIFDSLYIGLLGVITLVLVLHVIIKDNNLIPQKYKDMWKKNLLK